MNQTLRSKRWLVVDDEPETLALTTGFLSNLPGSEVVASDGPQQALEILLADPQSFELLVADFNMPGMNGIELSRRSRAQAPQLRVLLISGGSLELTEALSASVDAFLPKPFLASELVETVQKLLIHQSDATAGGCPRLSPFQEQH